MDIWYKTSDAKILTQIKKKCPLKVAKANPELKYYKK